MALIRQLVTSRLLTTLDAMVEPDGVETDMSTGTNPSEVSGQCAQNRDCLAGNENAGCNRLILRQLFWVL